MKKKLYVILSILIMSAAGINLYMILMMNKNSKIINFLIDATFFFGLYLYVENKFLRKMMIGSIVPGVILGFFGYMTYKLQMRGSAVICGAMIPVVVAIIITVCLHKENNKEKYKP
jgi:hypothetical protein